MIISKDKFARFPLEGLMPPSQTTGDFQPKTGESPEKNPQKTRSSFTVDLKLYLRIKSELTTI